MCEFISAVHLNHVITELSQSGFMRCLARAGQAQIRSYQTYITLSNPYGDSDDKKG